MENKTGLSEHTSRSAKYFKYAIGEIILVVIGILIALQINNWNENKVDLTHLFGESEVKKNESKEAIKGFIIASQFRNKLLANYKRKELVVNRIVLQKEIASNLIRKINKELE